MDLRLHAQVIWRWRFLVVLGLFLAVALATYSTFRVSIANGSLQYRQGKVWQSAETLLLTQQSCVVGQITCGIQGISSPASAASVAPLYAQIANTGLVRSRVFRNGIATAATGDYVAGTVTDASTGGQQLLPFLEFDGRGATPAQAVRIARRAVSVFLAYVNETSNSSKIPRSNRVVFGVVSAATTDNARVIQGRKFTAPILAFLAVMIVALGLVYLLENLFPRPVAPAEPRLTPVTSSDDRGDSTREASTSEGQRGSIESDRKQAAPAAEPTR